MQEIRLRPSHEVSTAWAIIEATYRGSEHWKEYSGPLKEAISRGSLFDVNLNLIKLVREWLGIETPLYLSSEITSLVTEDFLFFSLHLAEEIGADFYLSGAGNIGTIPKRFSDRRLKFLFQEFVSIPYPQLYPGWQSHMSVVDCLFTHGADYTRRIIAGGWKMEEGHGQAHRE
jgi:hypothetical protein